jgi:flagellar biosynthesis/type III secretory pathway chaperone
MEPEKLQRLDLALALEQSIIEMLCCKLETQRLFLTSGRHRWLPIATAEISHLIQSLAEAEKLRTEAACCLVPGHQSTLSEIAEKAPDPWGKILANRRNALLAQLKKLRQSAAMNQELLSQSLLATQDALSLLNGSSVQYGREGTVRRTPGRSSMVDAAI